MPPLPVLRRPELALLALIAAHAVAFGAWSVLNGYGADYDTFGILRVWQGLVRQHAYIPSRFQGGLLAELPIGAAAALGGSVLSNLLVVACTAAGLAAFVATLRLYGVPHRRLAVAAVLANGVWLVAGSTSMDYMLAFAPFALGLWALASGWELAGVLLLAAAAGARIFYAGLGELAILFVMTQRREPPLRIAGAMLGAFFVAGLFYLPVWLSAGLKLDWIGAERPLMQGLAGLVARFGYKLWAFFGAAGWLLLCAGLVLERRRPLPASVGRAGGRRAFAAFSAAIVAVHLALFAWIPEEPGYLLPALPFLAALIAALDRPATLALLAAGELIGGWVHLDPLRLDRRIGDPCRWERSRGFHLSPHLGPGPLAEELERRPVIARCGQTLLYTPAPDAHAPLPTGGPGLEPVRPGPHPPEVAPGPPSAYRPT